jgi:5-methylcytosine-specific restriction endonuclease McrA
MFDHLIEKSKYPPLEFEPENIALVCLECHDEKSRGIINAIYQEKINFVITKFNVS